MKYITPFLLSSTVCLTVHAQTNKPVSSLHTSLEKKIMVGSVCLCQTTLTDLRNATDDLQPVIVEEMDTPEHCYAQDTRYENGKGFSSVKYPGMIFQKDQSKDYISKIRLTSNYSGPLPDGRNVDVKNLTVKEVLARYPEFTELWRSRDCSGFWKIGNDTLSFFVKIDPDKPRYPLDEAHYMDQRVAGIDITLSCYGVFDQPDKKQPKLAGDPLIFIDSVIVTREQMQAYQPTDIAAVTIYKNAEGAELLGPQGGNGVVFIETKPFARKRYWQFFKSKSSRYARTVPSLAVDSTVVYILNGKVLTEHFEGDLSRINDESFISLQVIRKAVLQRDYGVKDRSIGVLIDANIRATNPRPDNR
ncbi:hypothetical protein [Chitinophaga agri]|uniref:TonB-dependent receptor plug domain-containing protein n=1 Tax=Chitinophaga agri TaxID=2703787 RepID=A0A6B9ZM23_9BACT|nr:hypothetical protein [Chitinophaga agri]QHS63470.1 hypothetical protein GWR21_28960 [Chitinophaga agri]